MIESHWKNLKPAKYQKTINSTTSQCLTCEWKCKLKQNQTGICRTRINLDGIITSFVYGIIPSISFNPIEKKPLYHFYPGTFAITLGTYGCNFDCYWCQNHSLSHPSKPILELVNNEAHYYPPEKIIEMALRRNCQGTSISFNEPTILFEYSLDIFKLAKKVGLYNTYVTNGYMTEVILRDLVDHGLDAMNIDIKGANTTMKKNFAINNDFIWRNAKIAKELGVHIEITTLLIEGFNTDYESIMEISNNISIELGKSTPFHLTRAFPRFNSLKFGFTEPTPVDSLLKARELAKKCGLDYVYLGNLSKSKYKNTYCPNCKSLVIKRSYYSTTNIGLNKRGECNVCGQKILDFL